MCGLKFAAISVDVKLRDQGAICVFPLSVDYEGAWVGSDGGGRETPFV